MTPSPTNRSLEDAKRLVSYNRENHASNAFLDCDALLTLEIAITLDRAKAEARNAALEEAAVICEKRLSRIGYAGIVEPWIREAKEGMR